MLAAVVGYKQNFIGPSCFTSNNSRGIGRGPGRFSETQWKTRACDERCGEGVHNSNMLRRVAGSVVGIKLVLFEIDIQREPGKEKALPGCQVRVRVCVCVVCVSGDVLFRH